jgi:hypothetical protein
MRGAKPALLAQVVVVVLVGALTLACAPALAAGPERPVTEAATAVGGLEAEAHGEVNPAGGPSVKSDWHVEYAPGASCTGAESQSTYSEEAEGPRKVSRTLYNLEPQTLYAFCLVSTNEAGEEATYGNALQFTTTASAPQLGFGYPGTLAGPHSAEMRARVNPEKQETTCLRFEYAEASAYAKSGTYTNSVPCENAALGAGSEYVQVVATALGLKAATEYDYRVVAENASSPLTGTDSENNSFTTLEHVLVGDSFSGVGPVGATVKAQLNVYDNPTTYYVQYGPTLAYGSSTAPATLDGGESVETSIELSGLEPSSEYHFRVVAESGGVREESADAAFKTLPESINGLPDDRAAERVSPLEDYDANVYVPEGVRHQVPNPISPEVTTNLPFQVATDGEAVAYVGDPTVGGTGARGVGLGDEYLARRSPSGWVQTNISPATEYAYYQAFSPNLTVGILQEGENPEDPGAEPLSPQAPGDGYGELYSRDLSSGREEYQPFFTSRPPHRSPAEFGYGFPSKYIPHYDSRVTRVLAYAGASEDLSRLLFEANDAFPGTGAVDGGEAENNLYESVDGSLSLVNVLPDGSTEPDATFGAPARVKRLSQLEEDGPDFSNVISADGSRVFWTSLTPERTPKALYVSEGVGSAGERTVQLDTSQAGGPGGGGRYWTASKDGSKVFFTDEASAGLTSDTVPGSGVNLYEYELNPVDGEPGALVDLTAQGEAGVQGVLGEGENESGTIVYFVATGVLSEKQQNAEGKQAQPGGENLYMLKEGGKPTFVATLSEKDGGDADHISEGEDGDWQPGLARRTAQVTPDGRSLVFMSNESLTGYDNYVGNPDYEYLEEVYVYEAESRRLTCASCNRSGEAPQLNKEAVAKLGAYVPVSWSNIHLPEVISDDGSRVFFDSGQPLVPQDTNGEQDVYEWERDGSGSCRESEGCVYLLTGGASEGYSYLVGTDATGDNVFVITHEKLVSGPSNGRYDLYDARVGAAPVSPPVCTGSGCQGVPAPPPTFATPASVTFEGVGNFPEPVPVKSGPKAKSLTRAQKLSQALKLCRKMKRAKRRVACEARARKQYGSTSKAKSRKGGK